MDHTISSGLQRHYRILGLVPGADVGQVKAAYRRLAKRWHPDRCAGDRRAPARFQKVNEAYRTIIDTKDRSHAELFAFLRTVGARARPRDIVRSYRARTISTLLLSRLALAYIEEGFFPDARDILERIDGAGPPLVSTYVGLAYLSFLEGDTARALDTLYRAKECFGPDASIVLNLSVLLKKTGRLADAYREIQEQADDAEEKGSFFGELAGSVSFMDDKRRVVRHLRRAVDDRRLELAASGGRDVVVRYLTGPTPDVSG
jgi:curved DNA-binding protein CbpA